MAESRVRGAGKALHRHDTVAELRKIPTVLALHLHHGIASQDADVIVLEGFHFRADFMESQDAEDFVVLMGDLGDLVEIVLELQEPEIVVHSF